MEFEACVPEPFEISIVSKEWIEPNLVFKLNMSPGADWEQAFRSYMGVMRTVRLSGDCSTLRR